MNRIVTWLLRSTMLVMVTASVAACAVYAEPGPAPAYGYYGGPYYYGHAYYGGGYYHDRWH